MLPRPKGTLSEIALGCAELRSKLRPVFWHQYNATRQLRRITRYFEALGIFEALGRARAIGSAASHTRAKSVRIENLLVSPKSAPLASSKSARISRLSTDKAKVQKFLLQGGSRKKYIIYKMHSHAPRLFHVLGCWGRWGR